jgi:hypothetical protein
MLAYTQFGHDNEARNGHNRFDCITGFSICGVIVLEQTRRCAPLERDVSQPRTPATCPTDFDLA